MEEDNKIEKIKDLIKKDRINEALEYLIDLCKDTYLEKEALVIKSSFAELEKKISLHILDENQVSIKKNKIRYSLLGILEKKSTGENLPTQKSFEEINPNEWSVNSTNSLWRRIRKIFEDKE